MEINRASTTILTKTHPLLTMTMMNDCSRLLIPVIKEVFGKNYSGNEKIIFRPNEHFFNQQNSM